MSFNLYTPPGSSLFRRMNSVPGVFMGAVFTVALFTVKLWLDIIVVNPIVPVVLIVQAVGLACYVRKNEAGGGGTILGFGWVLLTTAMFL